MVDKKDFIIKIYIRSNGNKNNHKWYMHYCDKCSNKRSYAPKNVTKFCRSCASLGKNISEEQRKNISQTLLGNKNAANITPKNVIKRTAKRMKISVDQYVLEKEIRKTIRKMKKNMSDRLNRFLCDERKSVKYFDFTREQLIANFQSQFASHPETNEPMTWTNYGRIKGINCWEIDHVIPLRYKENGSFYWNQEELKDYKSETFKKAWSLNNLKPMWAKFNWSKGSRYKE